MRKEYFQLDDLLISLVEKFSGRAKQSSLFVDLDLGESGDFKIYADRDKITHVLINLLDNALKYAVRETVVSLKLQSIARSVRLVVINTMDVPVPDMTLLAQQFYRGEVLKQGYGLGLWINNKIMEAHEFKLIIQQKDRIFETVADFNGQSQNKMCSN